MLVWWFKLVQFGLCSCVPGGFVQVPSLGSSDHWRPPAWPLRFVFSFCRFARFSLLAGCFVIFLAFCSVFVFSCAEIGGA
jgi:hypothetical protein